ncbi:ABC transporter permease [Robbsia sp. KACC 23696]|uniref:ABC transporter permease n=1 Tax=Robbsia sp. KACC 23696 TaxID=3149231 RepID=UPI00325B85AC
MLLASALGVFLSEPQWFTRWLAPLTDNGAPAIYDRDSLWRLALAHLLLVVEASAIGGGAAIAAAVIVTRASAADFLPIARSIANIAQTFPPVAVLALAVPALGFGAKPVLFSLTLYGLLPVFESTLAGLQRIPDATREAAFGMGMNAWQRLWQVELPLAGPVIFHGVRLALVINLGTATIGSTVAASSLGDVIIAGLQTSNTAFIVQGAIVIAALAVLIYEGLGLVALWRWPAR